MLKSRKRAVEFETTAKEYSLADFYISFQDILPQVVMVTQGNSGNSICGTVLKKNQILFINAISRKKRVLTRCQSAGKQLLLGIPATQKVCLVEHGRCGKESYLFDILNQHTLPLTAKFPKDNTLKEGRHNEEPLLHLTQMFDEVHLLGNFVNTGNQHGVCFPESAEQLSSDIVYIPLHLADLRLCIVTGIAKQSSRAWHSFLGELIQSSAEFEYDMLFGQTDIADYVPDMSSVGKSYSYIQPRSYVNISMLMASIPLEENITSYENLTTAETEETEEATESVYDTIICPPDPPLPQRNNEGDNLNPLLPQRDKEDGNMNPPLLPRDKECGNLNKVRNLARVFEKGKPELAVECQANIQTRRNMMQDDINCTGDCSSRGTYANDVPRNEVHPLSSQQQIPVNENNNRSKNEIESSEKEHIVKSEKQTTIKVAELTISELGEYLEKLNLSQYIGKFRDALVDGPILIDLDRDVLKTEFGLSTIEAIRLYKFAQEGHVPVLK